MQESVTLEEPPTLDLGRRRATLSAADRPLASFRVRRIDALSRARAQELVAELGGREEPVLLVFRTASPEARSLLRHHGLSFIGEDGEWFLFAPPVYVERPPRRSTPPLPARARSPFSLRASRLPRWLLLHPEVSPTLTEVAGRLELVSPRCRVPLGRSPTGGWSTWQLTLVTAAPVAFARGIRALCLTRWSAPGGLRG
jgi:hypothetical protein